MCSRPFGSVELHPVADDERARHRLRARVGDAGSAREDRRRRFLLRVHGRPAYGRGGCDPCPLVRRGHSELSVGRPSLGPMTATVQTDAGSRGSEPPRTPRRPTRRRRPRRPSLSPSRAADFKTCPLLYRFRTIDRLPERKSLAAVRGTLVHSVLERLYDLPAAERTVEAAQRAARARPGRSCARSRASPSCSRSRRTTARRPTPSAPESVEAWLASAGKLVEKYFTLEDPTRIQPHGREELVEVTLPDGLLLRGFVDRLDVAPNGALRVVDYKTGARAARGVRGQGAVPDEVLRTRPLAHPRRGRRAAQAALPQGRRRAHLRPRRGRADPVRAHPRRDLGGDRARRGRPATSARTRRGSATGATTRPSAPRSAALPRRSRPRPPPRPAWTTMLPVVERD